MTTRTTTPPSTTPEAPIDPVKRNNLFDVPLLGVSNVASGFDTSEAALRHGRNVRQWLAQVPDSGKEMQLAMLRMHDAMKQAAIKALRDSAAHDAGEHLCMPVPTRAEIDHETSKFRDAMPRRHRLKHNRKDPLAVMHARLSEMHAELREHFDENTAELKCAMGDLVHVIRQGNHADAHIALEDMVLIAARNYILLKRQGVSHTDARELMGSIMGDLLETTIHQLEREPGAPQAHARTAAITSALLDMYFNRSVEIGH